MRADRVLSVLLLLQTYGKMTAKELAAKLEVSERTIVRDLEALSIAGVPVYAERGSQGGWRLAEGYRTNLTGMKAGELLSLILSSHPALLSDLGLGNHFQAAMRKLLAAAPEPIRLNTEKWWQHIHIDGAGWRQAKEACPYLHVVQEAVGAARKLRVRYPKGDAAAERVLGPLGLVAKGSIWYLVAVNEEQEVRTYRISRIAEAQMLDEAFVRPENFQLSEYWEKSVEHFKSRLPRYISALKIRKEALEGLKRERFVNVLSESEREDGWLEVQADFETPDYALRTVLGFGATAVVTAPGELRERVQAEVLKMAAHYSDIR